MNFQTLAIIAWKGGWLRLLKNASVIYSVFFAFINAYALAFPTQLTDWGWAGFFLPIILSFVLATILSFPRGEYSGKLISPDSVVKIKVGDLFKQDDHLVIGVNDVFDTQLGEIIKAESVQGQFLHRVYGGDFTKLDQEIHVALIPYQEKTVVDRAKSVGKNLRYPIGTTITLGNVNKRYFLTAYSTMSADLICTGSADSIIESLDCLWDEIRKRGQGYPISMPIIGSDLARTGLNRMVLIKLIAGSFILASKRKFITKELTITIHPNDIEQVNLYEIHDFLKTVCF